MEVCLGAFIPLNSEHTANKSCERSGFPTIQPEGADVEAPLFALSTLEAGNF